MIKWARFILHNVGQYQIRSIRGMCQRVFVYGTLKRFEPNHHWLSNPENGEGRFYAAGVTMTKYPLIIATKYNIPFLLYSPGNGCHVKGEVYEVNEAMLHKLDVLEDHPKYYTREIDYIIVDQGRSIEKETVPCWIYFLKNFRPELLSKPTLETYSSTGSHGLPYMERSKRNPHYDWYPEIKSYPFSFADLVCPPHWRPSSWPGSINLALNHKSATNVAKTVRMWDCTKDDKRCLMQSSRSVDSLRQPIPPRPVVDQNTMLMSLTATSFTGDALKDSKFFKFKLGNNESTVDDLDYDDVFRK